MLKRTGNGSALADSPVSKTQDSVSPIAQPETAVGKEQSLIRKILDSRLTTLLVLLVGISFLLYPVLSTLQNNYEQAEIVRKTWKRQNNENSPVLKRELERAEEYNRQLGFGPIFDPFLEEAVPDSPQYLRYAKQLNLHEEMGSISIPKVNILLPIYHGTSDEVLAKGVGHLFGSSLPVGGKNTETILTGHSGLSSASMFDNIRDLVKGDAIYLLVQGRKLKYTVTGTKVVLPENTKALKNIAGQDKLVLITCTPYGINTHRLLVFAERAELSEKENKDLDTPPVATPWRNWMIISISITLGSLALFFFLAYRKKKKQQENKTSPTDQDLVLAEYQ